MLPHHALSSLLSKPKGLAISSKWGLLKEEKQEGGRLSFFSSLHSPERWAAQCRAALGRPRSHQGACNLARASGAIEPDARGLTRPASLTPGHKKLHKFPFKAKLDLRGTQASKT